MDASNTKIVELEQLLWRMRDGAIDDDGLTQIETLVTGDAEVRRFYIRFSTLCGGLRWINSGEADDEGQGMSGSPVIDASVSAAVALPHHLDLESSITNTPFPTLSTTRYPLPTSFVGGPVFSYVVATLILGVMLISAWAYQITHFQPQVVQTPSPTVPSEARSELVFVGRISGMKECRWSDPQTEAYAGASVPLNRRYALSSGLMEITYKTGARVILEGPCTYIVESPAGGYLALGKLTARIEERREKREERAKSQAANYNPPSPLSPLPSPLFFVRTPTAVVTDLGTEFGVEVSEDGNTTSHVFRGSVMVQVVGENLPSPAGRGAGGEGCVVLRVNESARVEKNKETGTARLMMVGRVGNAPQFVRRMFEPPKLIDLLDVVAGGNGTGKSRERGIDPVSGRYVPTPVEQGRDGDGQYWPVVWHRMIDGTFVPGGEGAVQLNSAGDTFDGFSGAMGRTFGHIWVRAADADPNKEFDAVRPWMYAIGRSERFMPDGRGLLGLHPNAGLTFDLQAVRKRYPGSRPERFQATIGVADSLEVAPIQDSAIDFRVFVDGRLTLKRIGLTRRDGAIEVDVKLDPRDRFLTLVATDGGDGITSDWFVIGDPVLKITPINKEETKPMKQ